MRFAAILLLLSSTASASLREAAELFMKGDIDGSVKLFDQLAKDNPDGAAELWQRGIALFYAKRYEDGAKQFELHKTVNPEDVENAAWHFLCVAKWKDVETARRALIPIKDDGRIPMMKVHDLYAGKATTEDVIAAVNADKPGEKTLRTRLFYAHLYIGLYYEATGDAAKAKEHISAAAKYDLDDYMCGVAKVHVKLMK
jgi:lipoprotein NlpI